MDVDPKPESSWLGTNGYVSPLAHFPSSSFPPRTSTIVYDSQSPKFILAPPDSNIKPSNLTPEQYERRMQNILRGLREREEEESRKPVVIQCLFEDVPGRVPLPISINELALAQNTRPSFNVTPLPLGGVEGNRASEGHSTEGGNVTTPKDICTHACPICTAPPYPATVIDRFFTQFPDFRYNQRAPARQEFARLQRFYGRRWSETRHRTIQEQFEDVMVDQFNKDYGSDEHRLESWQYLCAVLRIHPIPESVEGCKQKIESYHVNLVDLLDYHRSGIPVPIFSTVEELRNYTKRSHKIFPRQQAKAGGVLKFLLRRIF
ncbi:hypothetical protein QCA50_010899 [Cerrena zonata]|uniref:Uncharacterized protein n=1 Tax=Cerrena zonata TaxID=2478898 RepID=A0AAW0G3I4_9APHY